MTVSNTNVTRDYQGNAVTTSFPVVFDYQLSAQIKVARYNATSGITDIPILGTDYNVSGPFVVFVVAPGADETITVYRQTPMTQEVDYIDTGAFQAEDHETGMDRMTMMIQEIAQAVTSVVTAATSSIAGGAYTRLPAQGVLASGTVTVSTNQRMIKSVTGPSGGGTANSTTPVDAGSIDGQELRLVGGSDGDYLTIPTGGNVVLNGAITFVNNTVLDLFWDDANSKWVETGRNE